MFEGSSVATAVYDGRICGVDRYEALSEGMMDDETDETEDDLLTCGKWSERKDSGLESADVFSNNT